MIAPIANAGRVEIRPLHDPEVTFTIMLLPRTGAALSPEAEVFVRILVAEVDRATRHSNDHFAR